MTIFPADLFLQMPTRQSPFVPAGPVRAHLLHLSANGIGYRRVADLAGLTAETVRRVMCGRDGVLPSRVSRVKAEQLLAVHLERATPTYVPALGTQRRIQALRFNGWSPIKLADRLGYNVSNFNRILTTSRVRATTAAAAAELFDQLWDTEPPLLTTADRIAADRNRTVARQNGWVPALAWDDIDTDPTPPPTASSDTVDETVDDVAVELACEGHPIHLQRDERLAAIRILHGRYLTDKQIAERLHLHYRVVFRYRAEDLHLPATHNAAGELVLA